MKTLISNKSKVIMTIALLVISAGSFAKSSNKSKEVKKHQSLQYYMGVDGKKHYVHTNKSGLVTIHKNEIPSKEWYTLMAFTRDNGEEGCFHPEGGQAYVKVILEDAK